MKNPKKNTLRILMFFLFIQLSQVHTAAWGNDDTAKKLKEAQEKELKDIGETHNDIKPLKNELTRVEELKKDLDKNKESFLTKQRKTEIEQYEKMIALQNQLIAAKVKLLQENKKLENTKTFLDGLKKAREKTSGISSFKTFLNVENHEKLIQEYKNKYGEQYRQDAYDNGNRTQKESLQLMAVNQAKEDLSKIDSQLKTAHTDLINAQKKFNTEQESGLLRKGGLLELYEKSEERNTVKNSINEARNQEIVKSALGSQRFTLSMLMNLRADQLKLEFTQAQNETSLTQEKLDALAQANDIHEKLKNSGLTKYMEAVATKQACAMQNKKISNITCSGLIDEEDITKSTTQGHKNAFIELEKQKIKENQKGRMGYSEKAQ